MSPAEIGLPEALERAASALPDDADAIRPANGDPVQLATLLGEQAAVRVLAWLLTHETGAGAELAGAWAEDPDGAGAAVLRIDGQQLPKPARKVLRRIHHGMRSRGLAVPEASPVERVSTLPPVEEDLEEARITPIDPSGARAIFLATRHPSGGARLFQLVIDDARGVLEFEVMSSGRSNVRRFFRDFSKGTGLRAIEVPVDAVRLLIARALESHPADRSLPRGLTEWRSVLTSTPPDSRTPGAMAREALDPDAENGMALAETLVRGGRVGPWPPASSEALAELARKLGEIEQGVVIVSGHTKRDQVRRVLDESLAAIFDEAERSRAAHRFEETAYVLWKADAEDEARSCLAAADAFRTREPADNPLALALIETVLAPVLARLGEEPGESEAPSLLVKP